MTAKNEDARVGLFLQVVHLRTIKPCLIARRARKVLDSQLIPPKKNLAWIIITVARWR